MVQGSVPVAIESVWVRPEFEEQFNRAVNEIDQSSTKRRVSIFACVSIQIRPGSSEKR